MDRTPLRTNIKGVFRRHGGMPRKPPDSMKDSYLKWWQMLYRYVYDDWKPLKIAKYYSVPRQYIRPVLLFSACMVLDSMGVNGKFVLLVKPRREQRERMAKKNG